MTMSKLTILAADVDTQKEIKHIHFTDFYVNID